MSVQALSQLLSLDDLKSARLVCLAWSLDLAAGITDVTIWPGRLRPMLQTSSSSGRRLRSSTRQRSLHEYCPQSLMSGISSTAQVSIISSDMCSPTAAQLQQVAGMLASSASRALEMDIAVESCIADRKTLPLLAKPLLSMLQSDSQQHQQHITSLKLGAGFIQQPSRYIIPAVAACRRLRKLILQQPAADLSQVHLQQLCSISGLQQLHLPLEQGSFSSLFPGSMQQVLDLLAGLTQLTDLALSFHEDSSSSAEQASSSAEQASTSSSSDGPASRSSISIPDWPRMTSLQQLNKEPNSRGISPAPKLLGPLLASNLQDIALDNFQLPSSCTVLASLTSLDLLHGQDISRLPGAPELRKLQVHRSMTYLKLLDIIRKAPQLQVRSLQLSAAEHVSSLLLLLAMML